MKPVFALLISAAVLMAASCERPEPEPEPEPEPVVLDFAKGADVSWLTQMEKEGWMVIKIIRANMAGLPDLLLLRDGVARWVEVKQPGKKPTVLQSARHALLRRMGFSVEVMDGTKQAESVKSHL